MKLLPLVALAALAAGCGLQTPAQVGNPAPAVPWETPVQALPAAAGITAADLARLTVDDQPKTPDRDQTRPPDRTYNRDRDWQPDGWIDADHNGCDSRKETLIRDAGTSARRGKRCSVEGTWPRVYVTGETTDPGALQIDHVVALSDAWRSGAWAWFSPAAGTARMRAFTQDFEVLWAVDGKANGAKGDRGPGEWEPANPAAQCEYARRYVYLKVKYALTVTTRQRDGAGRLLDVCRRRS